MSALTFGAGVDDPLTLGVDEYGRPVRLPVSDEAGALNILIGGAPGTGKSNTLSVILADLGRRPDTALVLGDPKLVEFGPWTERATCTAYGADEQLEMLGLLHTEMMRRYRVMARSYHAVTLAKEGRTSSRYTRRWRVGVDGPRLVAVFDELGAFMRGSSAARDKIVARMLMLLQMGRAAELAIIMATQRPSTNVVPGDLRDAVQLRCAHKTMSPDQTEMLLGMQKVPGARWQPDKIPTALKGVGFVLTDRSPEPKLFRAYKLTDAAVVDAAAACAPLRVTLPGWPATIAPRGFFDPE